MSKSFTIYRSSAGSGKTRTLAKEYLLLALGFRSVYFKQILAVTFTNKATQEMKDRILHYLNTFARGEHDLLAEEIKQELSLDDSAFRDRAQELLSAILHGYSQFSISTIDAFFQKVIRSFTREAGLAGDYRLEIDHAEVLEEVVDNLIDELGSNEQLTDWVVKFATENLENEKAWDIRGSLIEFSREIFKEEYKNIEDEVIEKTKQPERFVALLHDLRAERKAFVDFVESRAGAVVKTFESIGATEKDFKYSGGGVFNVFRKLSKISSLRDDFLKTMEGKRITNDYQIASNWGNKDSPRCKQINALAAESMIATLNEIHAYGEAQFIRANSADIALSNLYAFGLIADITRKLRDYKNENNLMLLADAPKFLNGVIQDSDAPFVYEKVGSFYRNYLIDEFQDTSGLQWKNFYPLLNNSLAQGYKNLVVGDVKQAIYRWRGGDLKLLQEKVESDFGADRIHTKVLDSNFRSASSIVAFNNELFKTMSALVTNDTGQGISMAVYSDVEQRASKSFEGFVDVGFIADTKENPWKTTALQALPATLEKLQAHGVALRDVSILVRKKEEGQDIVRYLMNYKISEDAKQGMRYDVVSNESLRVDGAASVRLVVGAMRYLLNPDDDIARAEVAYEFFHIHKPKRTFTEIFAVTNQTVFDSMLPPAFGRQKLTLKKLPLYELTEALIQLFDLREQHGEFSYIQAFQDAVLKFTARERNDLAAFLEWWELKKNETVIKVPEDIDAAQILTIHKSKGLQFRYVIIPFCSWNMDHEFGKFPNLWVKSDEAPFADAGYIPVRYASKLRDSYFAAYYEEEHTRSYLDNLNLLYVALTRAEIGLMVMAPFKERRGSEVGPTSGQLFYEGIQRNETLRNGWDESGSAFRAGSWHTLPPPRATAAADAVTLETFPSSTWSDKLVIRQEAKEFFEGSVHARDRINYGVHLHAILSRVRFSDDVPDVLDALIADGLIAKADRSDLQIQIHELLQLPEVSAWFTNEWDVRTEVPILLPGGAENRIDRLMISGKRAVIVDFKTGEPSSADQKQVLEYIDVLRQMNFVNVEGYLLYVRTGSLVAVAQKKVKSTKKKDDNQLALGL